MSDAPKLIWVTPPSDMFEEDQLWFDSPHAEGGKYIRTDVPEVLALVDALAWYADEANHEGHFNVDRQRCDPSLVDEDNGEKARAIIAAWDKLTGE